MTILLLHPAGARADGIGGNVEFNFSKGNTETRDASGGKTETDSTFYFQRYRLNLDKRVWPNVALSMGGAFDRSSGTTESDGLESDSTVTRIRPFVDLTLNSPLLTLGGGFRRDESWSNVNGNSSPKQFRDQSYARFGYRPDGFPTLDVQVGRNENYDANRILRDTTDDSLNVSSRFSPIQNLQLSYFGAFSNSEDRLQNRETRTAQHSGTASYSRNLWRNRAVFSGMYNVLHAESEITSAGSGEIAVLQSPFSGLAALTDTPGQILLLPNPALIDGNTATGSGIDIGVPVLLGDARPRNIGLDFVVNTELNVLHVWVDKPLPPNVVNAFSWEIYTSGNNLDWTLRQTVFPAPFTPFDNRFEIRFQNVVTRYVKLVTRPLANLPPPTVEFPDPNVFRSIVVTELQAFISRPAAELAGKDTRTSQSLNLDARLRILEVPSLYYQVSYFITKTTDSSSRYTVSNSLLASHRFNRVLSGSAKVGVDYSEDQSGRVITYLYNAALTAVPLPTVTQTFTYSGRAEDAKGIRSNFHSLYVNNTAELYRGVNANLGGGLNLSNLDNGVQTRGASASAGLSLVPHRTFNVNMVYSRSMSERTGGSQPETSTNNRVGTVSASFAPVRSLYLFGDWNFTSQSGQTRSETTNFGAGWSPFPDGNLHFSFPYTETRRTADDSADRGFSPSVRWNITRRASLNFSYAWFRSESNFQESRSTVYNANFRVGF